ncbi:MAG: tetratricopeptide repeat protein [Alphaproteobacteria bacterium]|nr:tetratricopeptide repeat protein [Alphaproteobacteria bacterium]
MVRSPTNRHLRSAVAAVALAAVCLGAVEPAGHAVFGSGGAWAQEQGKEEQQRRRAKTLSPKASQALQKMLAEFNKEPPNYPGALEIVNQLLESTSLTPFDRAMGLYFRGSIYASMERYREAQADLSQSLGIPDGLDYRNRKEATFTLAKIYMVTSDFVRAIGLLEQYIKESEADVPHEAYYLLGAAYAQTDQLQKARGPALKALDMAANDAPARYYQLAAAILLQLKDYKTVIPILERGLPFFPTNKDFWRNLQVAYAETDRDKEAFQVLELMYLQGFDMTTQELRVLADQYRAFNVPIKAVKLIEREMAKGRLPKDFRTWKTLADSYLQAKEWEKARGPLREAAKLSPEGDLFYDLCQSYFQDEQYRQAEEACVQAVNKGKLRNPGNAWFLIGYARYEQDKFDSAVEAMEKAAKFDKTKDQAEKWLAWYEQEKKRKAAVDEYLKSQRKDVIEELKNEGGEKPPGTPQGDAAAPAASGG